MSTEYLIIDPHGGHNSSSEVDDGVASPSEMVKSAKNKGIIPAITSHNTLKGVPLYLEAMDQVGWKKVALPGVEFSYRVVAVDLDGADNYPPDPELLIWVNPDRAVYTQDRVNALPCREAFCQPAVWETRQHLLKLLSAENVPLLDSLTALPKSDWKSYLFPGAYERKMMESLSAWSGWITVQQDPGFAAFYSRLRRKEQLEGVILKPEDELLRISNLAHYYLYLKEALTKRGLNKGEIICLIPNQSSLLAKIARAAEYWRENGLHKTESLTTLFDFLQTKLSKDEFSDLVWHAPHPVSIDATPLGKLITRLKEGRVKLFSPEIFLPEIAEHLSTIEVLNAAHPGQTNNIAEKIAEIDLFKNKGRVGASDSHHPYWVGSGATLVKVEEVSTDGILLALKEGRTLPLSGWREWSHTWLPFFTWMATITVGKKFYDLPGGPLRRMYETLDVQTPAQKAIQENLLQNGVQNGWVE